MRALSWPRSHVAHGGAALEAVAALGHSDLVLSFDAALKRIGITKKLPHQFSDEFVRDKVKLGEIRRTQGRGQA